MTDTTTDELQKKLDAALASIEKLSAKNAEILEENKKRKAEADDAREAAEAAAEAKEREGKDIAALEKRLADKHAKELAKLQDQLSHATSELTTLKVDNAIRENLTKHGFDAEHHDILFDAMKAKAKLEGTEAMIGDTALEDYVASFASSDKGKRYMPAPANAGAGAMGGKSAGTAVPDQWNLTKYTEMKNESPELAAAYASKHGKSF